MKKILLKIIPKKIISLYSNYKLKKEYGKREGDSVICVICDSKFKKFGDYGLANRQNAECYNCGSLERHRLLWKYLNEKLRFFENKDQKKVLHFAPEKIFYDRFENKKHIEYVPCDLFPEKYNYKGSVKVEKVDITKIPYSDNYFDFIICNHVLEHIPDDALAMSELFRVLKKGGSGIFQVPMDVNRELTYEDDSIITPKEREIAFGQQDHVRLYGRDYKDRLESAGFNVNLDNYVEQFSDADVFKFGFMSSEIIYKCGK